MIARNTQPCPTCGTFDVTRTRETTALLWETYDSDGNFCMRVTSEAENPEYIKTHFGCNDCGDVWVTIEED